MFGRNERSTLFSACITICSIRSRQSLKLFDARVIDAPPPPSPPPPAPPSRHHHPAAVDTATAPAAQQSAIRPYGNLRQFVGTSLTDVLIMNIVFYDCECRPRGAARRGALRSTGKVIYPSRHIKKISLNQRVPRAAVNNVFGRDSR